MKAIIALFLIIVLFVTIVTIINEYHVEGMCTVRTVDNKTATLPDPWKNSQYNGSQCFAPPKQKCCNQIAEGCMQDFRNYSLKQIDDWKKRCL